MSQVICHSSRAIHNLEPLVDLVIFNVAKFFPMSDAEKRALRAFSANLIHRSQSTVAHVFVAIILLRRLHAVDQISTRIVPGSMFLLVSVVMILSRKLLDDTFIRTKFWSLNTGIPIRDLNQIERELLGALEYNMHVSSQEYAEKVVEIVRETNVTKFTTSFVHILVPMKFFQS
jgi:hypothetical protein